MKGEIAMEHNYSCICFSSELTNTVVQYLKEMLKKGTKIYFFTYDPLDKLFEDTLLKEAIDVQLLFANELLYTEELNESFSFYNGDISNDLLELLKEKCTTFNAQQFLIEHAAPEKNIGVSAGAGTGKTTVMINRILYLKHSNPELDFSKFGLITFTNTAAGHMREKLVERIKIYFRFTRNPTYLQWLEDSRKIEAGTIHSFAHKILLLNRNALFEQMDLKISGHRYKRRKIIEKEIDSFRFESPELFRKFQYIEQYKLIKAIEWIMDYLSNHSISAADVAQLDFGTSVDDSHLLYERVVKKSFASYQKFKEDEGRLDVNDLIIKLEEVRGSSRTLNIPYKYLFIDEFQDSDQQQTKFFAFLNEKYKLQLFVVGDIKQSIYRFRGADYTAFQQLERQVQLDFKFHLQLNYRSADCLIKTFNELFSKWPSVVQSFTYDEEDFLHPGLGLESNDKPFGNLELRRIDRLRDPKLLNFLKEHELTNTAVLVRSNREVNELALICEQNNIFHTAERDGDFYRTNVVREFYQLILRFTHPSNWKNRYLLHLSSYGKRTIEVSDIINEFSPERIEKERFMNIDTHLDSYVEKFSREGIFDVINQIIQDINPAKIHAERFIHERSTESNVDNQKVLEMAEIIYKEYSLNLSQLIILLKKDMKDNFPSLYNLESSLRLKIQTDKIATQKVLGNLESARLTIMTVHKAKGLEFDYVCLPNAKEEFNNFTKLEAILEGNQFGYRTFIEKGKTFQNNYHINFQKTEKNENVGEEARLLYVAMTRAKKQVFFDAPDYDKEYQVRSWGDLIAKDTGKGIELL